MSTPRMMSARPPRALTTPMIVFARDLSPPLVAPLGDPGITLGFATEVSANAASTFIEICLYGRATL